MIRCFTCTREIVGAFDAYNCARCAQPTICCSVDRYCKARHEQIVALAHPYCLKCAIVFEENAARHNTAASRIDARLERAAEIARARGSSVEDEINNPAFVV